MGETVKKAADDAKDAFNEMKHKTNAGMEHVKRDVMGDQMTAGDKMKSVVHEDVEKTKADIDKAKRTVRDHT